MSERVNLADGSALDMLDPESVRAYVRRTLALTVEPTPAQLRRLEMLEEHAAKLEAAAPKPGGEAGVVKLVDAKRAVEVLRRRVVSGDGEK